MKFFVIFLIFVVASLLILVSQVYSEKAIEPVIQFDKEAYSPFDWVQIKITYPPANVDPTEFDALDAKLFTTSGISKTLRFGEIEPNAGIFASYFKLRADPEKWSDGLEVPKNDALVAEFKTKDNMTFTKKADINFNLGVVRFNKDAFSSREQVEIIVWDPDRNKHPNMVNTLPVMIWSTTDDTGLMVTLRETEANSGEFHTYITLTRTETSSGNRLRVSDGDTITARYTDNTRLPTDQLSHKGLKTFAVREVLASALISDCFCAPLERATTSDPMIYSTADRVPKIPAYFDQLNAGDTAIIRTEIANAQNRNTPFAYLMQIKNSDEIVVSLSWIRGELAANETMKAETTWIPESSGTYTMESFIWSDIDNPDPLGPTRTTEVKVQ